MHPTRIFCLLLILSSSPWLWSCAVAVVGGAATGVLLVHDRRTAGTILDDQNIELKANHALEDDLELKGRSHINVVSYNNIVLLTGETASANLRAKAETLVTPLPKVRRVYNEIHIADPSRMEARSRDIFITTKVKSALLQIKIEDFDPSRVKVTTEQSTVYLMGLLRSQEANAVVARTRKVGGVRKVVKVFEYLN